MGVEIRDRLGRSQLVNPGLWLAILIGAGWTVAVAAAYGLVGSLYVSGSALVYLLITPLALIAVLVLSRRHPPFAGALAGWMMLVVAAFYADGLVVPTTTVVLAFPALALSAVLARRYPALFFTLTMLATGFFGTAQAFLSLSPAPLADVLVAGLWLCTIWTYLLDDERRRVAPFAGLVLMTLYVLISFFEIFTSGQGFIVAAQDFRGSTWYLMSFLLLVVAPIPRSTIRRSAACFVGVAVAVGGYATLRWVTGQSGHELHNAIAQTSNNYIGTRLRLIGSFVGGKELAAWTATAIPFCLAVGLGASGKRRALALLACVLCAVAMFGSDVRVALVAVVAGVGVVFVLYQLNAPAAHLATTLSALLAAVVIGAGAFALTLGGNSDTGQRYNILLSAPTQDPSYQARLFKWRNALADIGHHPFGQGLGTAGRTQARFGRFVNISNIDVDNSYLKIALEQGAVVGLFYIVALVLLAWGLARRAVKAADSIDAALAIGAVGVLVVFAILLFAGTYIEGLTALTTWLFVGIGAAGVAKRRNSAVLAATEGAPGIVEPWPPMSPPRRPDVVPVGHPADLLATARALSTDGLAHEVWRTFDRAGVQGILLKGATLEGWLYDDGAVRAYSDVDLLIAPDQLATAEQVLTSMGFRSGAQFAPPATPHARPWQRASSEGVVDLHWTVPGACVAPQEVWRILRPRARYATVGGGQVWVLDQAAIAMLVALHVAQHQEGKPLEDLARALSRASLQIWREAAALAERLHASYGFASGLRMLGPGDHVADALGLPSAAMLGASATNPGAALVLGFERLSHAPGVQGKLGLLRHELAPEADFMRWRFPLARRGRLGLALTYVGRPGWLAWHALPSARTWRRTRKPPDKP